MSDPKLLQQRITKLKRRSTNWHCPVIAYWDGDDKKQDYDVLPLLELNVEVNCYWSTANVYIRGKWKNDAVAPNLIFCLRSRGSVTDCTVKVGSTHVRTVATINDAKIQDAKEHEDEKDNLNNLPEWKPLEKAIFNSSNSGNFFLPFRAQTEDMNDLVYEIECEYTEPLRIVNGLYYFRLPLIFYDTGTKDSIVKPAIESDVAYDSAPQILNLSCTIKHANSMKVTNLICPSHIQQKLRSEIGYTYFEVTKATTDEQYKQIIGSKTSNNDVNGLKPYWIRFVEDAESHQIGTDTIDFGRPFELLFEFGTDSNSMDNELQQQQQSHIQINNGALSSFMSGHAINNPWKHEVNWQLAKIRDYNQQLSEKNKNNTLLQNNINEDESSLASLGLFISAESPLSQKIPKLPTCVYFVINGTSRMRPVWHDIIDSVQTFIGHFLDENDAFGICAFNELKCRHYISWYDEQDSNVHDINDENNVNINMSNNNNNATLTHSPRVYTLHYFHQLHQTHSENNDEHLNHYDTPSWRTQLMDWIEEWLMLYEPTHEKQIEAELRSLARNERSGKKDPKIDQSYNNVSDYENGVNISMPLMQSLCYLESDPQIMNQYFTQLIFLHHGIAHKNKNKNEIAIQKDSNNENIDTNNDENLKKIENLLTNDNEFKQESVKIDVKQQQTDLDEQDLMNKISFFYSPKAQNILNIKQYTTRIHTIGLGHSSNFAFLELLARTTRGFAARCLEKESVGFDLSSFLTSIRSPLVKIDKIQFNYVGNSKESLTLPFPFPIPDLYLHRPIIIKYYVESENKIRDIQISGIYLVRSPQGGLQYSRDIITASMKNNDLYDNDDWPLDQLLANEEICYWQGDYWFKQQNEIVKLAEKKFGNQISAFLNYAPSNIDNAQRMLLFLSGQTSIPSKCANMISFCMTIEEHDELTKQIQNEREFSKTKSAEFSKMSQHELTVAVASSFNTNQNSVSGGRMSGPDYSVSPSAQAFGGTPQDPSYSTQQSVNNRNSNGYAQLGSNSNSNHNHNIGNSGNNNLNRNINSNNNNSMRNEVFLGGRAERMRLNKKKSKNKKAAVAMVAVLGTLGVAALLNPFDGSDGGGGGGSNDDFFFSSFDEFGDNLEGCCSCDDGCECGECGPCDISDCFDKCVIL